MDNRINMGSMVLGIALGMWLAMMLAGVLQERSRRLWIQDAEASDRAWEEVAGRAYERGFVDGARAAGREVESAVLR